jgi:hypothetical protein
LFKEEPMKIRTARAALCGSSLLAAAVLAACGGGGGSADTPVAAAAITQANYLDYASTMGHTVVGMNGGTSAAGGLTGGSGSGAAGAGVLGLAGGSGSAGHARAMSATAHPQAVAPFSDACTFGGSISGSANFASSSTVTPGDSLSATFTNCVEESGGAPMNGGMTLQFNAFRVNPLSFDVGGSFTNFTAGTPALNGGFRLQLSENNAVDTLAVGFSGMKIGSDPTVYDTTLSGSFASDGSNASFSISGSVTTTGGRYTLTQLSPFTLGRGDPVSGALRLSDSDGNAVVMSANADGTVVFAYYPKGATQPTATSSSFSWAQFKG